MALLRAVLRNACASDEVARRHLAEAARLGVDPLDYCAHRFGLGNEMVWRRAAAWAGFTFAERTPSRGQLPVLRGIDHLGQARTLRQRVLGRDIVFCAPGFERVLALAGAKHLASHVRFVPPEAIEAGLARAAAPQLMDNARQRLTQLWPHASAAISLPVHVRLSFSLTLGAILFIAAGVGAFVHPLVGGALSLLLMLPGLLRLVAAMPIAEPDEPRLLDDAELPFYTVLIPLRDEAKMVPLLARAMAALDYPPEKLDIKFVVESASPSTVAAVERLLPDPRFRLIEVLAGPPATKPKALDYALPLARGEYLVVYDAEDVPDPDQLRKAASHFAADAELACLQAELVPENAGENVLTTLFAGEYAGLFGRLLPALARWGLPVPLGGTSNHFRTAVLRELGGWDAFNVTEDADLGVRLRRRGLRAEILNSRTLEEAPVGLLAWMAQRRRWMKGWMRLVNSMEFSMKINSLDSLFCKIVPTSQRCRNRRQGRLLLWAPANLTTVPPTHASDPAGPIAEGLNNAARLSYVWAIATPQIPQRHHQNQAPTGYRYEGASDRGGHAHRPQQLRHG